MFVPPLFSIVPRTFGDTDFPTIFEWFDHSLRVLLRFAQAMLQTMLSPVESPDDLNVRRKAVGFLSLLMGPGSLHGVHLTIMMY